MAFSVIHEKIEEYLVNQDVVRSFSQWIRTQHQKLTLADVALKKKILKEKKFFFVFANVCCSAAGRNFLGQ